MQANISQFEALQNAAHSQMGMGGIGVFNDTQSVWRQLYERLEEINQRIAEINQNRWRADWSREQRDRYSAEHSDEYFALEKERDEITPKLKKMDSLSKDGYEMETGIDIPPPQKEEIKRGKNDGFPPPFHTTNALSIFGFFQ